MYNIIYILHYLQEACQCYQLALSYFQTYYNMVEKLLNRAKLVTKEYNRNIISTAEESGIETDVKNEEAEVSTQTSSMSFIFSFRFLFS